MKVWWCEEHDSKANTPMLPIFGQNVGMCQVYSLAPQPDFVRCRFFEKILTPLDSLVIEKEEGVWPDSVTYKAAEIVEGLLRHFPSIGNLILGEQFGVILLDELSSLESS